MAAGATRDEVEAAMQSAIAMHLELLREQGEAVPAPHTYATYVEVAA